MPQITSRTTAIDAIVYSVPLLTNIYDISYISPVFVSFDCEVKPHSLHGIFQCHTIKLIDARYWKRVERQLYASGAGSAGLSELQPSKFNDTLPASAPSLYVPAHSVSAQGFVRLFATVKLCFNGLRCKYARLSSRRRPCGP